MIPSRLIAPVADAVRAGCGRDFGPCAKPFKIESSKRLGRHRWVVERTVSRLAALSVLPPVPDRDWPWERCVQQLALAEGRVGERQFALLTRDHWYRSDTVWSEAGVEPGPGVLARLESAADWYRGHLKAAR